MHACQVIHTAQITSIFQPNHAHALACFLLKNLYMSVFIHSPQRQSKTVQILSLLIRKKIVEQSPTPTVLEIEKAPSKKLYKK